MLRVFHFFLVTHLTDPFILYCENAAKTASVWEPCSSHTQYSGRTLTTTLKCIELQPWVYKRSQQLCGFTESVNKSDSFTAIHWWKPLHTCWNVFEASSYCAPNDHPDWYWHTGQMASLVYICYDLIRNLTRFETGRPFWNRSTRFQVAMYNWPVLKRAGRFCNRSERINWHCVNCAPRYSLREQMPAINLADFCHPPWIRQWAVYM